MIMIYITARIIVRYKVVTAYYLARNGLPEPIAFPHKEEIV